MNAVSATRGETRVKLREPVLRRGGQVTIALDDLSALIGQPLVYSPDKGVSVRAARSVN
ncbi:hypothetical protein D3C84_1233520 [compost metagenome]